MELYTLDSLLRRAAVIDMFESMIWTERFNEWGDFEVLLVSTPELRQLLPTGTLMAMSESYRVMMVELVEDTIDADGRAMLKISGRSLEALLDSRAARDTFANLTTTPKWTLTGTPANIVREIINKTIRNNTNFPDDNIPLLYAGSLFPPGTIPESTTVITIELTLSSVYKAIQEICQAYDLGFRFTRYFDMSQLRFDIYTGNNLTTRQTGADPVVFAPNLDNLTNISSVTSVANYKNVAYVFHPNGVQIVYADGTPTDIEGFDRKVLTLDASDIKLPDRTYTVSEGAQIAINAAIAGSSVQEDKDNFKKLIDRKRIESDILTLLGFLTTGMASLNDAQRASVQSSITQSRNWLNNTETPWLNKQLQQRGRDELMKNRQVRAFDGEIPPNSPYLYEIDYQLGDLIDMRNVDGVTNQMRVTEQIFISDGEGERAYPTFTMNQFIEPGSWLGWDYSAVWATAPGEWATA